MKCGETARLSAAEFLSEFNNRTEKLRIPLTGSIDLTNRCNLSCVHCYLGEERYATDRGEMDTAKVLSVVDEITDAGCLNLLITGGEPLLRNDFFEIYRRAKESGLLITIFTNGTLITDSVVALFDDLPPHAVEISLYGASPATYERITGVKGSYDRCLRGIRTLVDHHISVSLKTILMTLNRREFHDIENIAEELGVKFRFDPSLFPRFDGDRSPVSLRVSPEEAVEKEFSDAGRAESWKKYFEKTRGSVWSDNLYHCGAGVTSFHIDSHGFLKPCLMSSRFSYDLSGGSFLNGWSDVVAGIAYSKAGSTFYCNRCEKRFLCDFCPAFSMRENGAENIPSEYLCELGSRRFQKIHNQL